MQLRINHVPQPQLGSYPIGSISNSDFHPLLQQTSNQAYTLKQFYNPSKNRNSHKEMEVQDEVHTVISMIFQISIAIIIKLPIK